MFAQMLKKYLTRIKAFLSSKNALTFLFFLLVATAIWLMGALDRNQSAVVEIPLRYTGIPENILITNTPTEYLRLNIRDKGKQILAYRKNLSSPLTVDVSRVFYERGEILVTADQLSGQIARYMQPTTIVDRVSPDSIIVSYEKLHSAKVAVVADCEIDIGRQHIMSDKVIIEPEKITVFGAKHILDTLKYVSTEHIVLKNLKDSTVIAARLKPIPSLRFAVEEVMLTVNVETFTEKQLQIPVTVINCPKNVIVKTFPAVVTVKFNVGLQHFKKITADDIRVIFDYNKTQSAASSRVILLTETKKRHITGLQIFPNNVEFIIEK